MNLNNPKQAIYDAFRMTIRALPVVSAGGETWKPDSTILSYNQTKANMVIRALDELPPHLRSMAIYCFAPDGAAEEVDVNNILVRLWSDFIKDKIANFSPKDQARLLICARYVVDNFRRAANGGDNIHSMRHIATMLGYTNHESFAARYGEHIKAMENHLGGFISGALRPIKKLISEYRRTLAEREVAELRAELDRADISVGAVCQFFRMRQGVVLTTLDEVTRDQANLIRRRIDATRKERARRERLGMPFRLMGELFLFAKEDEDAEAH